MTAWLCVFTCITWKQKQCVAGFGQYLKIILKCFCKINSMVWCLQQTVKKAYITQVYNPMKSSCFCYSLRLLKYLYECIVSLLACSKVQGICQPGFLSHFCSSSKDVTTEVSRNKCKENLAHGTGLLLSLSSIHSCSFILRFSFNASGLVNAECLGML